MDHTETRSGLGLSEEVRRLKVLLEWWGDKDAKAVTVEDCLDYGAWRLPRVTRGTGERTVDLECNTLSNVFNWAALNARKTGIQFNPIRQRPRLRRSKDVRHCTEVMPVSDEEFHQIASALLAGRRSAACGWQWLVEGMTGCRTGEVLALRWDAQHGQPGFMDDTSLYIERKKSGMFPYVLLTDSLRDMLTALRNWHKTRQSQSPWFIPGRNPDQAMRKDSLNHALRVVCRNLGIPLRTSHGLRAYYVRVMRSLGIDDSEIAKRLGQRSGVRLVETTYGLPEPGFFGRKTMDFLPNDGKTAWAPWS